MIAHSSHSSPLPELHRYRHSKIVIGVPAYNEERFLLQALESLRRQTHADFHVLISDNASIDATARLALEICSIDKRFSYFQHSNNIGSARNFQFLRDSTDSPYFMWLGAHDMLANNAIETMLAALETDLGLALAYSQTQWIDEAGMATLLTSGGEFIYPGGDGLERYIRAIQGPWGECTALNGVFRRSALAGADFRPVPACDHVVLTRAQYFGCFYRCEQPLYLRREFKLRAQEYIERITGGNSLDSPIRGLLAGWVFTRAQLFDFLRLPAPFKRKLCLAPRLVKSLYVGYSPLFPSLGKQVSTLATIICKILCQRVKGLARCGDSHL